MNKQDLISIADQFLEQSPDNRISEDIAISKDVVGLNLFDAPIFAFGDAKDEYFLLLKQPEAIGSHFLVPTDWLPDARTFMPVLRGNSF